MDNKRVASELVKIAKDLLGFTRKGIDIASSVLVDEGIEFEIERYKGDRAIMVDEDDLKEALDVLETNFGNLEWTVDGRDAYIYEG